MAALLSVFQRPLAYEVKIVNALAWQPSFELFDLLVERNESIFGYFVKFFPPVSSNSLLIAEIQADKEGGQAEYGRVLLSEIEDVLEWHGDCWVLMFFKLGIR